MPIFIQIRAGENFHKFSGFFARPISDALAVSKQRWTHANTALYLDIRMKTNPVKATCIWFFSSKKAHFCYLNFWWGIIHIYHDSVLRQVYLYRPFLDLGLFPIWGEGRSQLRVRFKDRLFCCLVVFSIALAFLLTNLFLSQIFQTTGWPAQWRISVTCARISTALVTHGSWIDTDIKFTTQFRTMGMWSSH